MELVLVEALVWISMESGPVVARSLAVGHLSLSNGLEKLSINLFACSFRDTKGFVQELLL